MSVWLIVLLTVDAVALLALVGVAFADFVVSVRERWRPGPPPSRRDT